MVDENFFDKEACDRCHGDLMVRTTSWFNSDTICATCARWEEAIIKHTDKSKSELEGCGDVPSVEFTVNWGGDLPSDIGTTD